MNKILLNVGETCKVPDIGIIQCIETDEYDRPCDHCILQNTDFCPKTLCMYEERYLYNLDGDNIIFKLVE